MKKLLLLFVLISTLGFGQTTVPMKVTGTVTSAPNSTLTAMKVIDDSIKNNTQSSELYLNSLRIEQALQGQSIDSLAQSLRRNILLLKYLEGKADSSNFYIQRAGENITITGLATATATLYTVTNGKTFYMTGYSCTALTIDATNISNYTLSDNATAKATFLSILGTATAPQSSAPYSVSIPNTPVLFTTNVKATRNNATGYLIYNIYGFER